MGGSASKLNDGLNAAAATANNLAGAATTVAASSQQSAEALSTAMRTLQGTVGAGASVGYFGGARDEDPALGLREYEASLSAKAKEDVVRRVGRALSRTGVSINAEGDVDDIVKAIVAQVPNPKNGGKFANGSVANVCKAIARALNDEFSPGATKGSLMFIDTTLSAEAICRAVSEWTHSFAAGVNVEFLAVHASVNNILRNIVVLGEVMEAAFNKIKAELTAEGSAEARAKLDTLGEVYERAQSERKRQEETLKNILHTTLAPAAKELELAMQDISEEHALVKKVGLNGSTLASALFSIGAAGAVATRVHKALKATGLSVDAYLKATDLKALVRELDAKVTSGSVPHAELAKYLEAANTLRTYFDRNADAEFRAALEEAATRGGAPEEPKTAMQKRVARTEVEKKVVLKDFAARMSRGYDELHAAVKALGPELGRKFPLTEKTDNLRDALAVLKDMRQSSERIELSLVGMYLDAEARQRKETFTGALRAVARACEDIMELELYAPVSSYVARLKAAIESIEKTIDYFADAVTKKWGQGEEEVTGGADSDYLPEIARSGVSLKEAVDEFAYYYYVAKVRVNLAQTSAELESYGEKYVDLLASAVAQRLYTLNGAFTTLNTAYDTAITAAPADADLKAAKQWLADEHAVKTKFYSAVQAMDLYMKAFTAGIAKDPEAVQDIKAMLDGTQVIALWFSEQTGDEIWKAFEEMQAAPAPGGAAMPARIDTTAGDVHYYERLSAANKRINPVRGIGAVQAATAKSHVNRAIDFFQGLKNLVNAFARIGDRFGGREVRTQVFMSPAQIYKVLIDYLKQSALSVLTVGTTSNVVFSHGAGSNFEVENKFFALIIKAMSAKILTTLGVFDMFERTSPIYSLTPTRMIIGGAGEASPEAIEGATELYFRLPRLAEFYYDLLGWKSTDTDPFKIAMLPEMEGVFSGLIRIIFVKAAAAAQNGDYSDSELRELVREINLIYEFFREKHGAKACQEALNAFVQEVNRRYGVVKQSDMEEYNKIVKMTRMGNAGSYPGANNTNYSILPGEDEAENDRRPPSDRYMPPGTAGTAALPFAGSFTIPEQDRMQVMVKTFRDRLDAMFNDTSRNAFTRTSYSLHIKQSALDITRATTSDAKLDVAFKLIQSASEVSTDAGKAFMFHETVVTGLNALSAIEQMVARFAEQVSGMNPSEIEDAIVTYIGSQNMTAGGTQFAAGADLSRVLPNAVHQRFVHQMAAVKINPRSGVISGTYDQLYALANELGQMPAIPATLPRELSKVSIYEAKALYITHAAAARATGIASLAAAQLVTAADLAAVNGNAEAAAEVLAAGGNLAVALTALNATVAAAGAGAVAAGIAAGLVQALITARADEAVLQTSADSLRFVRYLVCIRTVARLLTDYDKIMQTLLESLYALSSSGLVDVKVGQSGVTLGFSKLRGSAEELMAFVKSFFEQMRPYLSTETIDRYEKLSSVGSIYWIQQHLIDACFSVDIVDEALKNRNSDTISLNCANVFKSLNRDTRVYVHGINIAGAANVAAIRTEIRNLLALYNVAAAAPDASKFENFGRTLSRLVYYDHQITLNSVALNNSMVATARQTAGNAFVPQANGGDVSHRYNIYDTSTMTNHRSLMFAYNQLIGLFINTFVDTAAGYKIYFNLVNSFANGTASQSVSSPVGFAFPDILRGNAVMGARPDVRPSAVLCQSLAYILQRIMKDANPTSQLSDHLVTTLADIPLYMKESMRANLPTFMKMFDAIVQKGEFLKQVMQKTGISLARPSAPITATVAEYVTGSGEAFIQFTPATAGGAPAPAMANGLDSAAMGAYLASVIDAVSAGSYTLSNAASEVLKELGDNPVFFQTNEGSIETYKMRNGKLPLMPLSLSLWFLHYMPNIFLPKQLGSQDFKMIYGHRQFLLRNSEVKYDQIPGVKSILETYNGVSTKRDQIDSTRYLRFSQVVVDTLRFVTNLRNFTPLITQSALVFPASLQTTGGFNNANGGNVFAFHKDVQAVLTVVESTNQDDQMSNIVGAVTGAATARGGSPRADERMKNLIDMNIIPINIHALMRDIPLVNLYNYGHTFDQMLVAIFNESAGLYEHTRVSQSSKELFLRMMLNPYMAVDQVREYGRESAATNTALMGELFRGDNGLGMGRPKFLSDQVFNKALLGSVFMQAASVAPGVDIGFYPPSTIRTGFVGYTYTKIAAADKKTMLIQAGGVFDAAAEDIGFARFNTDFIRNLIFVTNAVRVVRLKLHRELTMTRSVLVSSHEAVAAGVTEYGSDPYGPNEAYGSTFQGLARFD